jgi:type IV secretory pathway VirJ component
LRPSIIALVAGVLLAACGHDAQPPAAGEHIDGGRLGSLAFFTPDTAPQALVFLFSDASGWNAALDHAAATLRDDGAAVLGVDLPSYQKGLRASDDGCHYLLSEIEALSQKLQRKIGGSVYRTPILAGVGEGGTLAYAALAQSPAATVAGAVSVDPAPVLDTKVPLCKGAPYKHVRHKGFSYGAQPDLPGWWVVSTRTPLPHDLAELVDDVDEPPSASDPPLDRLVALITKEIEAGATAPGVRNLPLTEIEPEKKKGSWMAVIYSGDGGWRDLDKEIGEHLAARGVPVVGVDSLRYFWSKKTPDEMGRDLGEIIDAYGDTWGTEKVVVVGYSFGADVLPFAVNRLPAPLRARVVLVSLLGLEARAPFQIEVEGWLGTASDEDAPQVMPELLKIDKSQIQCFYGAEEDDTICPDPQLVGADIVRTEGGHHFDGDYAALAQRIFDAAQQRTKSSKPAAKSRAKPKS